MNSIDLIPVTEDNVEEHVFDILVTHAPPEKSDLGVYERKDGVITVDLQVPKNYSFGGFHEASGSSSSKTKRKAKKKTSSSITKSKSTKAQEYGFLQLDISQSISLFTSGTESSTTGAMLWRVSVFFTEWLLNISQGHVIDQFTGPESAEGVEDKDAAFKESKVRLLSYPLDQWDVIEVGCGSSALVCSALGPVVHKYVATDHLGAVIRQAESNILANVPKRLVSTISDENEDVETKVTEEGDQDSGAKRSRSDKKIKCVEFDWEDIESGIKDVAAALGVDIDQDTVTQLTQDVKTLDITKESSAGEPKEAPATGSSLAEDDPNERPLVILACDTVFNEFLIPYLLDATASLCHRIRPNNSHVIVAQQVRDPQIMESFMEQFVSHRSEHQSNQEQPKQETEDQHQDETSLNFRVFALPDRLLSRRLVRGYTVHYAQYSGQ